MATATAVAMKNAEHTKRLADHIEAQATDIKLLHEKIDDLFPAEGAFASAVEGATELKAWESPHTAQLERIEKFMETVEETLRGLLVTVADLVKSHEPPKVEETPKAEPKPTPAQPPKPAQAQAPAKKAEPTK